MSIITAELQNSRAIKSQLPPATHFHHDHGEEVRVYLKKKQSDMDL